MKSVLYVGATLMIGASVYGFVDSKQASKSKEFTGMYVEEKQTASVVKIAPVNNTMAKVGEPEKFPKQTTATKKVAKKTGTISNSIIDEKKPLKPIQKDELAKTFSYKKIEKPVVDIAPSKEHKVKVKRKNLSTKIFSRAPMKYDIEEVTIMPAKVTTQKENQ